MPGLIYSADPHRRSRRAQRALDLQRVTPIMARCRGPFVCTASCAASRLHRERVRLAVAGVIRLLLVGVVPGERLGLTETVVVPGQGLHDPQTQASAIEDLP